MPMTPLKALGVPAVVGLFFTIVSYVLAFMVLAFAGQKLFPDVPGDQPIFWAAVIALLFASLGGSYGALSAFRVMKRQFKKEQAERAER